MIFVDVLFWIFSFLSFLIFQNNDFLFLFNALQCNVLIVWQVLQSSFLHLFEKLF